MRDRIAISPVTRIEGHANVTIHLNSDGTVREARFNVTDFRGFERFCEGRPYYEMPALTSRVCGICPVSHLLASTKACDELVAVTPSETAIRLRRLMHMGQIIQSHALSFFHLSSPDILLGMESDPSKRNILGLLEKRPELAKQGIRLRKFGQTIIENLSGKRIHSSDWILPGGVRSPLSSEKARALLLDAPEALRITQGALLLFKQELERMGEEVRNFGEFPTLFLGLVNEEGGLEHYDGKLRIIDSAGKTVADRLDPKKYYEYIGEAVEPWSYMKFPYYKPLGYPEGAYRVGPLARLNIASRCGTPLADEELKQFKRLGKNGIVLNTFHYHLARLIEILFCIEQARKLLEDGKTIATDVQASAGLNRREGVGSLEAPRGTLFHHYKVDDQGRITWVNLIIATGHNNIAFNTAITQVARKYVKGKDLREGMLNRVEAVVRAFDPCLSCSTHALGEMPLKIQLYDNEGMLLKEIMR